MIRGAINLGFPPCVCGHAADEHEYGWLACRKAECAIAPLVTRCTFYRPSAPIDPDSPAAFAEMLRGMLHHLLPREQRDYDRTEVAGLAQSVAAQLIVQWKGWDRPEGT